MPPGPHQILRADVTEYRRNFFNPRYAAVVELAGTSDSRTAVAAFFRTRLSEQGWSDRGSSWDVNTPSGLPRYVEFFKGKRSLTLDFLDPGFFEPRDDVPAALRAAWPTVYRLELSYPNQRHRHQPARKTERSQHAHLPLTWSFLRANDMTGPWCFLCLALTMLAWRRRRMFLRARPMT